jgi:hypothetical protein
MVNHQRHLQVQAFFQLTLLQITLFTWMLASLPQRHFPTTTLSTQPSINKRAMMPFTLAVAQLPSLSIFLVVNRTQILVFLPLVVHLTRPMSYHTVPQRL